MARTVSEIKKIMTDEFIGNENIREMYSLQSDDTFESRFSKASIENIFFYIAAFCAWTVEVLFDKHKAEVEEYIDDLRPHTLRWYATKSKQYRHGATLDGDTDGYANGALSDEDIEKMQVVKYAAAVENGGVLKLKVATGAERARKPLDSEQLSGFKQYMSRVKDAGVILEIINEQPNDFDVAIDVYYNPMVLNSALERVDGNGESVKQAIAKFVEELPFNGEYRNSDLIEMLLSFEGVEFVELHAATCDEQVIDAYVTPGSGYFTVGEMVNIKAIMYESV